MKWEFVNIASDEAMNTPSEVVYEDENFTVSKTLIPNTYTQAKVCYFIDSKNDEAYGSVVSLEEAKQRIEQIKAGQF